MSLPLAAEEDEPEEFEATDEPSLVPNPDGDEMLPHCGMEDDEVERLNVPYSIRPPGAWVISGPLPGDSNWRGGRFFHSWAAAEKWAREKYRDKFIGPHGPVLHSNMLRWAFLIAPINKDK